MYVTLLLSVSDRMSLLILQIRLLHYKTILDILTNAHRVTECPHGYDTMVILFSFSYVRADVRLTAVSQPSWGSTTLWLPLGIILPRIKLRCQHMLYTARSPGGIVVDVEHVQDFFVGLGPRGCHSLLPAVEGQV